MKLAAKRAIAGALIVSLSWTPVMGDFMLSAAVAQTAQNTTYKYLNDTWGKPAQITDPLGNVTTLVYDPLNRVKQRIVAPVASSARPTVSFTYDGLDQASSVVDPRNISTSYTTDGLGNQNTLTSADTGATRRTFDAAGNLMTRTDARGRITSYAYDALNRPISVTYANGASTLLEYDGGAGGAPFAIGHLTRISDESGQTQYNFGQDGYLLGKRQSISTPVGQVSLQIVYSYSGNGQLASTTYPSGNRINYAYDAAGHVRQITLNPADGSGGTNLGTSTLLLDQISYAPFGLAQSWIWGNSSADAPNLYSRTFDLDGRVTSYPLGNPARSAVAAIRTVSYDAASRITGYAHSGNAIAATYDQFFGYDALGRVTSYASTSDNQGYAFDASNNRTRLTVGASSYTNTIATTSNRLVATTGPVVAKTNVIDNAGNLTSDGTTSFTYSDQNRLTSATKAGITTRYLYNGVGQRVAKSGTAIATGVTAYFYDEAGRLIGEYDGAGNAIQETVWLAGLPVIVLKPSSAGNAPSAPLVYQIYADHLGTPKMIVDSASGAVKWSWTGADPFGLVPPIEVFDGGTPFVFNLRFPGQYFDRETGLNYNYYRDYDPQTGRYIQSDPIGLDGGINTYEYVGGNPLTFADPYGQQATVTWCAAGPLACGAGVVAAGLAIWMASPSGQKATSRAIAATTEKCAQDNQGCNATASRAAAMAAAYVWAGITPGAADAAPMRWDMFNYPTGMSKDGPEFAEFKRRNPASVYGYNTPSGASVVEHPFGHPDLPGQAHHNCPHFHAKNAQGKELILEYKAGT